MNARFRAMLTRADDFRSHARVRVWTHATVMESLRGLVYSNSPTSDNQRCLLRAIKQCRATRPPHGPGGPFFTISGPRLPAHCRVAARLSCCHRRRARAVRGKSPGAASLSIARDRPSRTQSPKGDYECTRSTRPRLFDGDCRHGSLLSVRTAPPPPPPPRASRRPSLTDKGST